MATAVKRQLATHATGISNHPLDEEIRRQEKVPARGRRKSPGGTDRPTEPAPARRRGRDEGPDQEVPVTPGTKTSARKHNRRLRSR